MPPGRPRTFELEEALERALQVFWRKSYEGASLTDLTEAMGINRPSLYAAFGSKEELFCQVLTHYIGGPGAYTHTALNLPTARQVIEAFLEGSIESITNPSYPGGCLTVQGALNRGEEAEVVQQALIAQRTAIELALRSRLECAKQDGDLPATVNPCDLARYIMTVIQGMAVQAVSGATRDELRQVAKMALLALG